MRTFIIMALCIMFLATPVLAQSQSFHHEVVVELDGEWEYTGNFTAPEVRTTNVLKGVGKARIHSITKAQTTPSWWELF